MGPMLKLTAIALAVSAFLTGSLWPAGGPQFLGSTPSAGTLVPPGTYSFSVPLAAQFQDLATGIDFSSAKTYITLRNPTGSVMSGSSSSNGAPGGGVSIQFAPAITLTQAGLYTWSAFTCGLDGQCVEQDLSFTVQDQTAPNVSAIDLVSLTQSSPIAIHMNQVSAEGPFDDITDVSATLAIPSTSANTIDWGDSSIALYQVVGTTKTLLPMTRLTVGTPSDGKLHYSIDSPLIGAGTYEVDVVTYSQDASGDHFVGPPSGSTNPQFTTLANLDGIEITYSNASAGGRLAISGLQPVTLTSQSINVPATDITAGLPSWTSLPPDPGYTWLSPTVQNGSALQFMQNGNLLTTALNWTFPLSSAIQFHLYYAENDLPTAANDGSLVVRGYQSGAWTTVSAQQQILAVNDNYFTVQPPLGADACVYYAIAYIPFTPTPSPTFSVTPTVSPTSTVTPTLTPTLTASATATVTPIFTATATATATITLTPTPPFAASGTGKPVLGPVPLKSGDPLCLYFDAAPDSSSCQLYNIAGEMVANADFGGRPSPCLPTRRLAPGVYVARIKVQYKAGASRTQFQKIYLVR
jgi:hypothetical protein